MSQPVRQMTSVDNMKPAKSVVAPLFRGALLVGAVLLICGCVTSVSYESPYNEESAGAEIDQPPPPLPTYAQPPCPGDGYLWVPGYWAYSGGYYWVPGSWVLPPQVGLLWTPGYWGYAGRVYAWHAGYWSPHVGFYGGVPYGFGYDGVGYRGGRWEDRHFVYNRYVTNVDERFVHYTYNERVDRTFDGDRVSYEGGIGGIVAYPTRDNLRYAHEAHIGATPAQRAHIEQAAKNPSLFARENRGRPLIATTPHPRRFQEPDVERAGGAKRFGPQVGWSNGQPRPHFPSRPDVQERANASARQNDEARSRYQAPPAFHGERPGALPQPHQGVAGRLGPTGRPQGQPAPEKKRPSRQHDR